MSIESCFTDFLENEVELNPTRLTRAEKAIETVKNFLYNNELFKNKIKKGGITPQGSYRQCTIIKPLNDKKEFDVDILMEMKEIKEWEPKDYLSNLYNEFYKSDLYKNIVDRKGKTRCVTLDYKDDFHVDIVPCIEQDGQYRIMNKKENIFEVTDADGYAQWFYKKNKITGENLSKAIKLIKYVRDKNNIPVKSILLTTLMANQVQDDDGDTLYQDIPTSLKTIINRLNDFLISSPIVPEISNPVLTSENFNRHWDQEKYDKFKKNIDECNTIVNEAINIENIEEAVKKWQELFGNKFLIPESDKSTALSTLQYGRDLILMDASHCIAPTWPTKRTPSSIKIRCFATNENNYDKGELLSDEKIIKDRWKLKFCAELENCPNNSEIYWQVVNTGDHAASDHGLRGDEFFKGRDLTNNSTEDQITTWEVTKYLGKHWIEAFVVNCGELIARSGRFYIMVQPKIRPQIPYYRRKYR